jgi:glycosyltransferase involved in cell wall biosynthesis
MKPKLVRITTVPISLDKLLEGQLRFMGEKYDVIAVSSDAPYLERVAKREAARFFHLDMTRRITPFKDLAAVWKLYRFLRREKPLIVHSHTPKAGIVAMFAAKLAGVPHRLHTVAGLPLLEASGSKRKILDAMEKLTYACASGVYPNSSGLKKIILDNGYCGQSKLKVLGGGSSNGIDTSYFSPDRIGESQKAGLRRELGIQPRDFTFIFVGRLVGDKGINELVQAFAALSAEHLQAKLLLVGQAEDHLDPLLPETMQRIETHPKIISAGYQSDVRPYFAISDALVFPSYREGFPNVVMQAGAMGLPAIVSDINGCNEIVTDGFNGMVIPVKDPAAIQKAMTQLIDVKHFYLSLKEKSRETVVSRYEQRAVWQAVLDEYRTFAPNPD